MYIRERYSTTVITDTRIVLLIMMHDAVHECVLIYFCIHWSISRPTFDRPHGQIENTHFFVVVAKAVFINKHLDMHRNITCPPTLSYDKGVGFS